MRLPRLAFLTLALVLAGCATPRRDNPNDPASAPRMHLQVCDGLPCAEVAVVSRGHAVALDASGTTDRDGAPIVDATWRFSLVDSAGNAALLGESPGPIFPIPKPVLMTLPTGVLSTFRVELVGTSHYGFEDASVVLTNAPPVAVADPRTVLPEGGLPGNPVSTWTIPLTGEDSYDEDGDDLTFTWTLSDGTVVPWTRGAPPIPWTIPAAAGGYVATLEVFDGTLHSRKARTVAVVRPRSIFGHNANGFLRFDPLRHKSLPWAPGGAVTFLDRGATSRLIDCDGNTGFLEIRNWNTLAILGQTALSNTSRLAVDATATRVWAASASAVESFTISGDSLSNNGFSFTGPGTFGDVFLTVDSLGRAWSAGIRTAAPLQTYEPTGVQTASALIDPLREVVGLEARPQESAQDPVEVWTLQSNPADGSVALVRYGTPGGTGTLVSADPALARSDVFAWIGHDEFWISSASRGLRRIDATLLEAGATLDQATILSASLEGSAFYDREYLANPRDGSILLASRFRTYRVTREGERLADFGLEAPSLQAIDARGVAWFNYTVGSPSLALLRNGNGLSPATTADGNLETPFNPLQSAEGRDLRGGGLWLGTREPSLAHLFDDGRIRRSTTATINGVTVTMPPLLVLSASPDGARLWAESALPPYFNNPDKLFVVDPATSPSGFTEVPLAPSTLTYLAAGGIDGSFAWILRGNLKVEKLLPAGTVSAAYALPAAEHPPTTGNNSLRIAPMPAGGACVANLWSDLSNNEFLSVRRINAAGGVSAFGPTLSLGSLASNVITGIAAADDGSDTCWVSYGSLFAGTSATVSAFTTAGAIHTTVVGFVRDLVAPTRDDVFYSVHDFGSGVDVTSQSRFAPASMSSSEEEPIVGFSGSLVP